MANRKWIYPQGSEEEYNRILQGLVASYTGEVSDALRGKIETVLAALDRIEGNVQPAVSEAIAAMPGIGDAVAKFNKREFREILREHYGLDVLRSEAHIMPQMEAWEVDNIALIKSIPEQSLGRMRGKAVEALDRGMTYREFERNIQDEFGIARNRAHLIARDQIQKLNGNLTMIRQKHAGVKSYTWRGVLDRRERPEHVAREGEEFTWEDPPFDGPPGHPINCRCWADPVLPDISKILLT